MKNSNARILTGLAIVLVLIAGVFTVYSVVADNGETTIATGSVKLVANQKQTQTIKTSEEKPLSYCERVKASQVKLNYDKVVVISNNPDEACVADQDLVKYNYGKVTFV